MGLRLLQRTTESPVKPQPSNNPQNLDDLMAMAVDFAGFNLRSGRQTPPTLLAVTKKGPLFFTPDSLQDDRSKDDFADTARLICIAYQVPAAVMILESWMKMAAEGEKLDPDERPAEAMDRHEVVMVMGEGAGTTQRKVLKIIRTDAGGFFGLTEWEGLPMEQFQGRFVGLLSPKPLTAEVIEVARVMLAMKGLNEQKLRGGGRRR